MFDDEPKSSMLTELLFPLPAQRRTTIGILTWWESRRLLYNCIVGASGFITLTVIGLVSLLSKHSGARGEDGPLMLVVGYGVLANICYTLGPIVEIALERAWRDLVLPVGPALFRQGLAFSVGLTLLPIPVVICAQVVRLANFLFFHW